MNPNHNPDDFAQYLDDLFQSPDAISPDEVDDPLAEVALQLAQDTPPKLDPAMRARMLEKVQQANQARTTSKRTIQFPAQAILRWVAVLAVCIILVNNVAVPAMADSLPGDVLYPVKLTVESIELGLATSDETRADVYIRQAQRRIEEAQRLLDSDVINTQLITLAIHNLDNANQLVTDTSIIHTQVMAVADHTTQLVAQIAEHDPVSSADLYLQLADADLASAPMVATEKPDAPVETQAVVEVTEESTATATPTNVPTETAEPTATSTPTDVPTETAQPTATDTPTETYTPEPTPTHTMTATPLPTYESYIGVVSATANVNIRALPTTESEIVQQVAPGTIVTVTGESIDGEWLQISIDDEIEGWIAFTLIVEGTIPEFTLTTDSVEETPDALQADVSGVNPASDPSNDNDPNSSTNQGNDGINKFGCDGQGNSCNAGDQSNNSNNKDNNGKGKSK